MAGLLSIITVQLLAAIGTAAGASSQHCENGVSNPSCDVGEDNTGFIQLKGRQVLMESRSSDVHVIDVKTKYGDITASTVNKAMEEARDLLAKGTSVQINFAAGNYTITTKKDVPFIDLNGINQNGTQQLILSGAGMDATKFVMDGAANNIVGKPTNRVTIQHMTWSRTKQHQFATQGRITQMKKGRSIQVEIDPGYPLPCNEDGTERLGKKGRYIKRHQINSVTGSCDIIPGSANDQLSWTSVSHVTGQTFEFTMPNTKKLKKNSLIGIKSKSLDGQPYQFSSASDITFISNRWFHRSRGNFRGKKVVKNIAFIDCEIAREKPGDCLSTTGGGPQIGHSSDPSPQNITIRNFVAYNTGDDSVALFNVEGGVLDNVTIYNSFARGINLNNVNNVFVKNSRTHNCDLACQATGDGDDSPSVKIRTLGDNDIGRQGMCVSTSRNKCGGPRKKCDDSAEPRTSLAQSLES